MTSTLRITVAIALIALAPAMARAQAVATALSMTFGAGGSASTSGGDVTANQLTSLSMGSAMGSYAVAASSANGTLGSSSAVAGASMEGSLPPVLRLRADGISGSGLYETELFFGDPSAIPGYEQRLDFNAE